MDIIEDLPNGLVIINGIEFATDKTRGYLKDGLMLSKELIEVWEMAMMHLEGITELTDEHRNVIKVTQDYYNRNGVFPLIGLMLKYSKINQSRLNTLFPNRGYHGALLLSRVPFYDCYP